MNRSAIRVQQRVQTAWTTALTNVSRMAQASIVRPSNPHDVFKIEGPSTPDEVKLSVGPVVFKVPERPNRREADLYIVVKGWLAFEGPDFDAPLRTKHFGTETGYFRQKPGELEHIYGAHYDMDEVRPGHPVFHAQIASQQAFSESISRNFRLEAAVTDRMDKVLRSVRTPSAQMDVFAVITQICADHLMGEGAGQETREAFRALRNSCDFLIGAAHRLEYLNSAPAAQCYRSTHWYASPIANAP